MQLERWGGLFAYFVFAAVTVYLCLYNGWFQNTLTAVKNSYEEKWR